MKFLLVNQHYPPDPAPTGTLLAQLAEGLQRRGHEVTVITGAPSYEEARGARRAGIAVEGGVRVVRLPLFARTAGVIGRAVHYLSFAASFFVAALREPRPEAILAFSSTPLAGGFVAWLLAKIRGAAFVYTVQDVHPDIAIALGLVKRGWLAGLAHWAESLTWRSADRLVLIGKDLEPVALSRGVSREKVRLISNWADLDRIRPLAFSPVRRELGLSDETFVVEYAGNLGRSQDLETILEAARLLEEKESEADRPIRFLFVGGGAKAQEVEARCSERTNVRVIPFLSEDRVGEVLAAADLSLVPLRPGLTRYSVPSKMYSILASGRPIGASIDAGSEVARVVENAGCGFRVEPGDVKALADEIAVLAADADLCETMGRRAREWAERHGGVDRAVRAYERVLVDLASRSVTRTPTTSENHRASNRSANTKPDSNRTGTVSLRPVEDLETCGVEGGEGK